MWFASQEYRTSPHVHDLRLAAADIWATVGVSQSVLDITDLERMSEYAWRELEHQLMFRLTWRDPCGVSGCNELARAEFALIGIPGMPRRLKVCPRHEIDLMRSRAYRFQL